MINDVFVVVIDIVVVLVEVGRVQDRLAARFRASASSRHILSQGSASLPAVAAEGPITG